MQAHGTTGRRMAPVGCSPANFEMSADASGSPAIRMAPPAPYGSTTRYAIHESQASPSSVGVNSPSPPPSPSSPSQ